jgi:cytochrome P450
VVPFICISSGWGPNLVSSNKDDWRRHRRIMGPAFNTSTYSIVWAETLRVYRDIIAAEGWAQKDLVTLRPVQAYTIRLAYLVISTCGFGLPFRWEGPSENDDRSMDIQDAMRIWADSGIVRLLAPSWAYKLPIKRYILKLHSAIWSTKRLSWIADCATSRRLFRYSAITWRR